MRRISLFFFLMSLIFTQFVLAQSQCRYFYQKEQFKNIKTQFSYSVESLSVIQVQSRWLFKNNRIVTVSSNIRGPIGSVRYTRNHNKKLLNFEPVQPRNADIENLKNGSSKKLSDQVAQFFKDNSDFVKQYGNVALAVGTLRDKTGYIAVTMAKNANGKYVSGLSSTLGGTYIGNLDFSAIILLRMTDKCPS